MGNDVFGRGKIVFVTLSFLTKGQLVRENSGGGYERCISIDLGCIRSRCLFPMLRNADSAKENEDPYPGRMSLIERCNGQSAFGNACNIVASAKNLFFPVATILQASKALFLRCNNLASPQKHFLLVATILQMPKTTFSPLQQSCKHQKVLFPRCNNVASIFKSTLAIVWIP